MMRDHPVEIEEDDEHAGENFEAVRDLGLPMARAAQQNVAAMVEPLPQGLLQGDDARHDAIDEQIHIQRKPALKLGELEELLHHHFRIDGARARLDDDPHILGGFITDIGDERQFFLVEKLGDLFDELRLLHHIGNFGDDHGPDATAAFFLRPARPQAERARARCDRLRRLHSRGSTRFRRSGNPAPARTSSN